MIFKNYKLVLCIMLVLFIGCSYSNIISNDNQPCEPKAFVKNIDTWANDIEVEVYGYVKSDLSGIFVHAIVIGKGNLKVVSNPFFVRCPSEWTPFYIIVEVNEHQIWRADYVYIGIDDMYGEIVCSNGYEEMVEIRRN